jgi:F-type H+-transporting ATPase subunit a
LDPVIVAVEECDLTQPVCAPENVSELFFFETTLWNTPITRTIFLFFLAALVVIGILYFAYRKQNVLRSKFQTAVDAITGFVRDEVAVGIIGPEGTKYFPYLLSIFMFILVGNLFEVTPLINFPITSRMAIPGFLAIVTYLIFVIVGFAKNGFSYLGDIVWPKSVPVAMRPLVGLIEFVSYFAIRPFSLAVRLLANMVAGHVMLSLLLVTGWVFMTAFGDVSVAKQGAGVLWFILGLGIYVFEILVSVLQAYIFTLLSAVYIQTSVHPEH